MSAARLLAERLRAGGLRGLLRALVPRHVDEYLYAADVHFELPTQKVAVPVRVERYDRATPSGDPAIDGRLDARRICYVARIDGRIAHRSWLHFDAVLPSLFGFPAAPVIGDCRTLAGFRGMHLYPYMLAHIVADVRERAQADVVHVLVAPDNVPSIRGLERAGFHRVARLHGVRIGPFVLRLPARRRDRSRGVRSALGAPSDA